MYHDVRLFVVITVHINYLRYITRPLNKLFNAIKSDLSFWGNFGEEFGMETW